MKYKNQDLKNILIKKVIDVQKEYILGDHGTSYWKNKNKVLNEFVDGIMKHYKTVTKPLKGYKLMYVKASSTVSSYFGSSYNTDVYIPTVVEVTIPYHSIVYSELAPVANGLRGKSRSNQGIITEVWDPKKYYEYKDHTLINDWGKSEHLLFMVDSIPLPYVVSLLRSSDSRNSDYYFKTNINSRPFSEVFTFKVSNKNMDTSKLYSMFELDRVRFNKCAPEPSVYYPGKKIVVDNFDILPRACSEGFHFFEDLNSLMAYFQ